MICEVCRLVDRDKKEAVTVSMKDRNGTIWYTCKEHAQLMHNHNMVCWNCGSKKNGMYNDEYVSVPNAGKVHLISYDIFCKKCNVDVGNYNNGKYIRFRDYEDILTFRWGNKK